MKTVKFYWEFQMPDETFEGANMQEWINGIKSGKFQKEIESNSLGGKVDKCIATVEIE